MIADLPIDLELTWSRPQWDVLTFEAPPRDDGSPDVEIVGIVGDYGGGKTYVAGARFVRVCFDNPFVAGVHTAGSPPMSGIVAPTMGDLLSSTLVELRKVCPPELVLRERLYGAAPELTLINGHVIRLYSAKGAMNGPTLCQIWADEIQDRGFAHAWPNIQARVRDKRARRLNVQASGLAQHGHVEELFRNPRGPNRKTVLFRTSDNEHLAAGVVDNLLDSLSAAELLRDADGWAPPLGVMYPHFGAELNMCRAPKLADRLKVPTSMGVDLRSKAAVVFTQDEPIQIVDGYGKARDATGQLVVGQRLPENQLAEQIAEAIKREEKWAFVPGVSIIAMDPTAAGDEVNHFRRCFPGCRIVQAKSGPYHVAENGERAVSRALGTGGGNVRLFVHPGISKHERGVVEMLRGYSATKKKDGKLEHVADALRYIVQARLPLPDFRYDQLELRPQANIRAEGWSPL